MAKVSTLRSNTPSSSMPLELARRARTLMPTLVETTAEAESSRRVSLEVSRQLGNVGLLSMMQPARFGGLELGPTCLIRVGYELGRGCGSAAWAAMVTNSNSWFLSYWPLEAQREVWGETPNAIIASAGVPTGNAQEVEGGYEISGRWPFASNCDNADWFFVGAKLTGGDPPGGPGWFLLPRDALKIDQESWHVSGMQGTGSKTLYADEPAFVPTHRMIRMEDVIKGQTPGAQIAGNPLSSFLFSTFSAVPLVAPLLGMAQGALDWFTEAMRSKVRFSAGPGAAPTAAENPFIQERAGRAAVTIASALTYLIFVVEAAETKILSGSTLNLAERVQLRAACTFCSRQAVDVVNLLAEVSGANSANVKEPIQRFWRDINAAARHVGLEHTSANANLGKHLFGLDPAGLL